VCFGKTILLPIRPDEDYGGKQFAGEVALGFAKALAAEMS
jgi:hypothetical protein